MRPIEFTSSDDLMSVYMRVKYHPYFKELAEQAGGHFISKNDDWEFMYKIPMTSFLRMYKELSLGFGLSLDPFLQEAIGEQIKIAPHEFNLKLIEPRGIKPHIKPMAHQIEGLAHAFHLKKSLVGLPPGSGKSLIGKMLKEYTDIPFTILAPSCVKFQWKSEIKEMTGKDCLVIDGTAKKRVSKLYPVAEHFDWMIINYELLVNDFENVPKRKGVIIDEAHYLKNPDSKRTKAVMKYIDECEAEYVLLLTGTFLVNSLLDGWALMRLIDRINKKESYFYFKRKHCILDKYDNPVGFRASIGGFRNDLRKATYYRQKEEILDLPDRVDQFIDIHMEKDQAGFYRKAEEGILAHLSDPKLEKELDPQAQYTRLRQIAADPYIIFKDELSEKQKKTRMSAKIDWIENFLESFEDRTLIIYNPFNSFLERIKEELPNYPWVHIHGGVPSQKRNDLLTHYRDSNEKGYFLITDAMKTGSNIQFCNNFIFTTLPLTWADYDQLLSRIYRQGQKETVFIYHLLGLETIDHDNWELVQSKKDLMNDFQVANRMGNDYLRKALLNKKNVE